MNNDVRPLIANKSTFRISNGVDALVFDTSTGEIYAHHTYVECVHGPYDYPVAHKHLADNDIATTDEFLRAYDVLPRRSGKYRNLSFLFDRADIGTTSNVVTLPVKPKRGRPAQQIDNPLASVIRLAEYERLGWVNDYVIGGCAAGPKRSQGRFNVNSTHVHWALCMETLSTAGVIAMVEERSGETIIVRTAQYIIEAARIALGGIQLYLEKNQAEWNRLKFEVKFHDAGRAASGFAVCCDPEGYDYYHCEQAA